MPESTADKDAHKAAMERMHLLMSIPPNVWTPNGDKPLCASGKHRGKGLFHLDGRDWFAWGYECVDCGGLLYSKQRRTGIDKALWADDD